MKSDRERARASSRLSRGLVLLGLLAGCGKIAGLSDHYSVPHEREGGGGSGVVSGGASSTGGNVGAGRSPVAGDGGRSGAPNGGSGGTNAPGVGGSSDAGDGGQAASGGAGAGGDGGDAGADSHPPSCARLAANCGPAGDRDCCAASLVPAGTFSRENTDVATLSEFRLDDYELTVGRFRAFAEAYPGSKPAPGSGRNPNQPNDPGWDAAWDQGLSEDSLPADRAALIASVKCSANFETWSDQAGSDERRPMNCLSWYVAYAFCIWDGGRLPTYAEANYAAAGGRQHRFFPWSDPPDALGVSESLASYYVDTTRQCFGDGQNGCSRADLIVVGSKPLGNGRFGQADLSGNVGEWTLDFTGALPNPCEDCANLVPSGGGRIVSGGSYKSPTGLLHTRARDSRLPGWLQDDVGARCVRAP